MGARPEDGPRVSCLQLIAGICCGHLTVPPEQRTRPSVIATHNRSLTALTTVSWESRRLPKGLRIGLALVVRRAGDVEPIADRGHHPARGGCILSSHR